MRGSVLAGALLLFSLSQQARADGVVIIGQMPQGAYALFWHYNRTDLNSVRNDLFDACNRKAFNCQEIAHIVKSCFAFAGAMNGAYAYGGNHPTEIAAQNDVLRRCRESGGAYCQIRVSFCETEAPRLREQYEADWRECFGGDISSCHRALAYYAINARDRNSLQLQLETIIAQEKDRQEQQRRLEGQQRRQEELERQRRIEEEQRLEAGRQRRANEEEGERRRKEVESKRAEEAAAAREAQQRYERRTRGVLTAALPLAALPFVSFFISLLRAGLPVWRQSQIIVTQLGDQIAQWQRFAVRFIHAFRTAYHSRGDANTESAPSPVLPLPAPGSATTTARSPVPIATQQPPTLVSPDKTRAAERAMKLARAYIAEEKDASAALTDPLVARALLEASTLAARQLAIAEKNDPRALLTTTVDDEEIQFTLHQLKAQALHLEGMARYIDNPKKSLRIIRRAIDLDPSYSMYHFTYGLLGTEHDYRGAIRALQCAVDLQPENIEYEKALFRAHNISPGERMIAGTFKAAKTTARLGRWLLILGALAIVIGTVATFGLGNVGFAVLCIIGLAIGAKIHQWASR